MSLDLNTPPIFNLHGDLLYHILRINADMFTDEDALATTRFTSQVCRTWRYSMLNMPGLWGKLIDLDSLHGLKSIKWGEEIIRRSANESLLWIKADKRWCRPTRPFDPIGARKEHEFFFRIVQKNWERIQKLVLATPTIFDEITLEDLSILRRPAPNLEVFSVETWTSGGNKSMQDEAFEHLFSGEAPMLRDFSAMSCRIDLHTPWFQNLESLQLGWAFDIYECLTIISTIPNLQQLTVAYSAGPISYSPRPIVPLPRLQRIILKLDLEQFTYMLDHLQISHGCSLDLFTSPSSIVTHSNDAIANLFAQATSSISRASRHYFQSHSPQALDVTYSGNGITLSDDTYHNTSTFKLWCDPQCNSSVKVDNVFAAIAFPEFARVTELKLLYSVILPSAPFSAFLQCLSSIEILRTDESTLAHLTAAQGLLPTANGNHKIIFPNLIKICILSGVWYDWYHRAVGKEAVEFILSRIQYGHPISVLHLTECRERDTPTADILRLKEIPGLKVIFKEDTVSNG